MSQSQSKKNQSDTFNFERLHRQNEDITPFFTSISFDESAVELSRVEFPLHFTLQFQLSSLQPVECRVELS